MYADDLKRIKSLCSAARTAGRAAQNQADHGRLVPALVRLREVQGARLRLVTLLRDVVKRSPKADRERGQPVDLLLRQGLGCVAETGRALSVTLRVLKQRVQWP